MKYVNKCEKSDLVFNYLNAEISSFETVFHIFMIPTTDTKINLKNKGRKL
ncbi:hypothetical protein [Campylobacter sp. RM16187]|nr:hypothetical protein [Campylobacter sp. RM16187]